jgi:poly-gamma-glutamate synthesis protein (capsule biosynthesis protein)
MMKFLFPFIFLLLSGWITASPSPGDTSRISLVFAGDLMGHDEQIQSAWNDIRKDYKYDTCFSMIRDYISSADIAFLNLEVSLAGPPYKGYPQFSSPDDLAIAARNAGFDVFLTANNHSIDRGKKGLERTINVLDSIGIIHTGTFIDCENRDTFYPLIIEKNNIRLAVLNYSYGTNGLKVSEPNIVNYLDTTVIARDLVKAELADPDFIIVTMHWGMEYQRTENKEQTELAAFLFKNGANIIIGSHPHVIQPVRNFYPGNDTVDHRLVVYSLGNFISNQRERYRNGGLIFRFELEKTDATRLKGHEIYPVYVHKPYNPGNWARHFVLLPVHDSDAMMDIYKMNAEDKEQFRIFKKDTEEIFLNGINNTEAVNKK